MDACLSVRQHPAVEPRMPGEPIWVQLPSDQLMPPPQSTHQQLEHFSHHQVSDEERNGITCVPMPTEPKYAEPIMSPLQKSHPHLSPVITPQWPSVLTNKARYHIFPTLPPLRARGAPPIARQTLTDTDRRLMCLYADEHPSARMTEIGGMILQYHDGDESDNRQHCLAPR